VKLRALVLLCMVAAAGVVPQSATATDISLPEGAIPLGDGSYAIELKAPTPKWYTPELHNRVLAAAEDGRGVPLPANADVDSALLFTGIRPGSWMITPAWCTLNFVFGDPAGTSGVYVGTAGHCSSVGEAVTIIAAPGVLMNIGTTVASIDNGIGDDFGLIEIRPEMIQFVNPSMAIVAGPTGSKTPAFGDPVVHVGHGLVVGTSGTARPGLVTWTGGSGSEATGYGWDGAANLGDSGSGVRTVQGAAVGNLTHLVVGTQYLPAYIAGTNIDRILQLARAALATASLVPDPLS
jgi:hypothetical protein